MTVDPAWARILVSSDEDEAWQEQMDRADRQSEYAAACGFKYHHYKEHHDQTQDHPHRAGADRAAVAAGHRGGDVRHRPAALAEPPWAGSPPEHPGSSTSPHRRGDPVPPNAAPTITAPAEPLLPGSAGHIFPEEQTP